LEIVVLGFLIIPNLFSFIVVGYDKYQAKNRGWRVPERSLFLMAAAGGAIGVYLGMGAFRHKTKHGKFYYGIPILIIVNLLIYFLLFNKFML